MIRIYVYIYISGKNISVKYRRLSMIYREIRTNEKPFSEYTTSLIIIRKYKVVIRKYRTNQWSLCWRYLAFETREPNLGYVGWGGGGNVRI